MSKPATRDGYREACGGLRTCHQHSLWQRVGVTDGVYVSSGVRARLQGG